MTLTHEEHDTPTPGGSQHRTPLPFIPVIDASGSMDGAKLEAALNGLDELLPHLRAEQDQHPVEIFVRGIRVGGTAEWIDQEWVPVNDYQVPALTAGGRTPMGASHRLILDELSKIPFAPMFPPCITTMSDGVATDKGDLQVVLELLKQEPLFQSAVRAAIAIGTNPDEETLRLLVSDDVEDIITAHNPEQLVQYLKYVVLNSVRVATVNGANVPAAPISPPSVLAGVADDEIIWG